jgi:hypothetical protein
LHFRKEREDQARRVREAWEAISEKHKVEPLFSQSGGVMLEPISLVGLVVFHGILKCL